MKERLLRGKRRHSVPVVRGASDAPLGKIPYRAALRTAPLLAMGKWSSCAIVLPLPSFSSRGCLPREVSGTWCKRWRGDACSRGTYKPWTSRPRRSELSMPICLANSARPSAKPKQQQNSAIPEGKFGSKLLLIIQPASSVVYASEEKSNWFRDEHLGLSAEQPAPPCPPPRGAAA